MISAASGVFFGLVAATISLQVYNIQRQTSLETELSRDRDAILKWRTDRKANPDLWRTSLFCARLLIDNLRPDNRGGLTIEQSANMQRICGASNLNERNDIALSLLRGADQALIGWGKNIDPERKKLYRSEFSDFCYNEFIEYPNNSVAERLHLKKLAAFIADCDNTKSD